MDSTTTVTENSTIMNKPEFQKTGLGERLKSVRKSMKLSEKEVAARLHLSVSLISLLENENFADGPPVTFMRGYLRSYAKLLNLSEDEISLTLKELENSIPSNSSTAIPVTLLKPQKNNERYLRWLTYVIVLVLVILVSVWWSSHSRYVIADVPPAQQATTEAKPAATTTQPIAAETNPSTTTSATATITTATPAAAPDATTMTPATMPAATTVTPIVTTPVAPEPTVATPVVNTPEPAQSVTSATPAPAPSVPEKKPAKKQSLSTMKMVIPEPDIDND